MKIERNLRVREGGKRRRVLEKVEERKKGRRERSVGSKFLLYSERCIAQKLLAGSFHQNPLDSTGFDAPATALLGASREQLWVLDGSSGYSSFLQAT